VRTASLNCTSKEIEKRDVATILSWVGTEPNPRPLSVFAALLGGPGQNCDNAFHRRIHRLAKRNEGICQHTVPNFRNSVTLEVYRLGSFVLMIKGSISYVLTWCNSGMLSMLSVQNLSNCHFVHHKSYLG
jgi:hypothetical protein